MVDDVKKREDVEEEEEEETWCRHSLCWQKAVAQWLPGNDQGEGMARACGDVEEVSCGSGCRFQWSRSRFAAGSERGENARAFPSTAKYLSQVTYAYVLVTPPLLFDA